MVQPVQRTLFNSLDDLLLFEGVQVQSSNVCYRASSGPIHREYESVTQQLMPLALEVPQCAGQKLSSLSFLSDSVIDKFLAGIRNVTFMLEKKDLNKIPIDFMQRISYPSPSCSVSLAQNFKCIQGFVCSALQGLCLEVLGRLLMDGSDLLYYGLNSMTFQNCYIKTLS